MLRSSRPLLRLQNKAKSDEGKLSEVKGESRADRDAVRLPGQQRERNKRLVPVGYSERVGRERETGLQSEQAHNLEETH